MRASITTNDDAVLRDLFAKVQRLRDVTPVLKDVAAEIDRMTAHALASSRRVDGLPFAELADSTKLGRLRRRKGAWRKIRGSKKSTAADRAKRLQAALEAANFKPLVDTARGARSANARVLGGRVIRWSVVDYMTHHMAKTKRAPARNFSVFRLVGGRWEPVPELQRYMAARLTRHLAGAP